MSQIKYENDVKDTEIETNHEKILQEDQVEIETQAITPKIFDQKESDINSELNRVNELIAIAHQEDAKTQSGLDQVREKAGLPNPDETTQSLTNNQNHLDLLQKKQQQLGLEKSRVIEIKNFFPKGTLEKFNATEILAQSRKEFGDFLKRKNLRTLICYIEKGGIKWKKLKTLTAQTKEQIKEAKKSKEDFFWINPKLSLLTDFSAGELALNELTERADKGNLDV